MEFNKRLISLRKEKKLLQTDVAEKIGVARATYGAYEQGTRQPDFDTLQIMADFFEVTTDYLLGRIDDRNGMLNNHFLKTMMEMVERRQKLELMNRALTESEKAEYRLLSSYFHKSSYNFELEPIKEWKDLMKLNQEFEKNLQINIVTVAGQDINLSIEELKLFEELKRHPALFHDLATDPERKIKELLKLYEMKKMLLEEDTSDYGDGFGELKD
ncbi:helix-turn-helix domain-containing protein [Sporosarcina sp. FSL K6-5500]|uniref:helix-turn-helix domain-containing protein n=1 Tax=Sporosarcina sp. FSL K6-5500 TaxID=2921558 RepID=UPI0030F9ACCE